MNNLKGTKVLVIQNYTVIENGKTVTKQRKVYKDVDLSCFDNVKPKDFKAKIKIDTYYGNVDVSPTSYMDEKETASMYVLGMGLHTVQDESAHGNLSYPDKHKPENDYEDYILNDKGVLVEAKKDQEHSRYNQMITDTGDYIHTFMYGDGTKGSTGYASNLFTPYSKK